ncbi:threonine dehydrogenase-like Zn-dependent dehydrogenase [Streptomyces sp. KhCrAH-43]|uniref:zinc-dependent alcohol dehydrogenase family protein n=1 Tax=unclassified Streptomyces TaxID=2593676 RepID=UPI00035CF638|nr:MULTISPECIES: zinc-dependent alcohol dehydrogenase family protein [unclassified Streptomyces]MYS35531.1 alcohol dehydrogenase catalytic domain-containing protein [Streptomyces sp. SID4920]MYX64692.1 alcohol dehydrogenase catalytic domain-containing protein [Streptomyces sp. SID8373]RAJ65340.1 threonine dehydrogenase-like Zn-dependent dehydrogenase [Streptomyces sp. KhCrAH-43]
MRATVIHAPHDIRVEEVPDPRIQQPTDVVLRVLRACICGSDLWAYRGESARQPGQRIGHEFLGIVEEAGSEVRGFSVGDLVVAPFVWSDGTCAYCSEGLTTSCPQGGFWGSVGSDGGQGEAVRVPFADGTLVALPAAAASDDRLLTALLALSDVLGTGHHAAVGAGVRAGSTVAVVGDGAVGLCGVMAAKRLGAERIIALGRHTARTDIARDFGATDVVAERGDAAVAAVRELLGGEGAHCVIEAVGTEQSMRTAVAITRDGGAIGYVGVPHGSGTGLDLGDMFDRNIALRGGVAPVRTYIPELLPDVLDGIIDPSPVFDLTVGLDDVPAGYRAMDGRTALKVLVKP